MKKMVSLKDGSKYEIIQDSLLTLITKYCVKGNDLEKTITFKLESDFLIDVFLMDDDASEKLNTVSFLFEQSDSLYNPLNKLLGVDEYLVIDDDLTREEYMKTIKISRNNDGIMMTFENKLDVSFGFEKFNVCIINALQKDGRSKIDQHGYDIKLRLKKFFRDVVQEFLIDKTDTNEVVPQKVYKNNI